MAALEPQLVGDHLQRRAREAVPGEQIDRDLDQSRPRIGGFHRLPADQCRHRQLLSSSDSTFTIVWYCTGHS
jgi:hypothetical protein